MATAGEALAAGDLGAALAAQQAVVKAAPRDAAARWLLAELLLLAGEAERADRMLDAAALDGPTPALLEFRQLLRAEVIRQQVWAEGRAPKLQGASATPAQEAALRALALGRAGAAEEAAERAAAAEALRPRLPGEAELADGTTLAFDDLRDADDLAAPLLETLTSGGEHLLVPLERVASLEIEPARRPRDLCWRRARIALRDGTEGVVHLPLLYPGSAAGGEDALRLGRETRWSDAETPPVRGLGQRVLLAGEAAPALGDVARLRLSGPAGAGPA